jgi:hypothetical protein
MEPPELFILNKSTVNEMWLAWEYPLSYITLCV